MVRKLSVLICLVCLLQGCIPASKSQPPPSEPLPTQSDLPSESISTESALPSESISTESALATEPSLGDVIKNEVGGYSLRYIPGFEVLKKGGLMTLTAPGANPAFGPQVVLFTGTVPDGTTILSLFDHFRLIPNLTISEPVEIMLAGKPALAAQVTITIGNRSVLGILKAVLLSSDQMLLLLAGAPDGVWQDSFAQQVDALSSSIELFPAQSPAFPIPPSLVRQWAESASASSEQSSSAGSANQVTGLPQIFPCGENPAAWSPASQNQQEWIELAYGVPVQPTSVRIYESLSPASLLKIEAIDENGDAHLFCNREAIGFDLSCNGALNCQVGNADYRTARIRISMDLSAINKPVAFDAVELIGYGQPISPIPDEMTILPGQAPQGFLWRIGYEFMGSFGRLKNPDGMDVDDQGRLYVNQGGIVDIFDRDGNWIDNFDYVGSPTRGLKVAPDGRIVMADYATNQLVILTPDGSITARAGGPGSNPGQFVQSYPQTLAIHPTTGEIYAPTLADSNLLSYSVNVFTLEGKYVRSFQINDPMGSSFPPDKLAFSADGFLYAVSLGGAYVIKFDTSGNVLAHLGEDSLSNCGTKDIALDRNSNIYVGCSTGAGVMKISPEGKLMDACGFWAQGVETQDLQTEMLTTNCNETAICWQDYYMDPPIESTQPEGGISMLTSLAVQPDGSQVYISEWGPFTLSSITSCALK
jgi:hypothetical protein